VPLLDSGLAGLVNVAQNALITGTEPRRHGNAHPNIVPYEAFETESGQIAVAAANDGLFRRLCDVLGRDDLAGDERYATNPGRVEHRDTLIPELQRSFAERPAEHWVDALGSAGVPVGKVRSIPDALSAAAGAGRPATLTLPHPTAQQVDLVSSPIWGEWDPGDPPAPPLLGQHTDEVLAELGCPPDRIDSLVERGAAARP
jgi:crotonobetainyl-CoA:carnitine CoA-transferase CaiB-like acyl-CoA transferase